MANFFSNLINNLVPNQNKNESVIGLDIGSSSIKVVQLKKKAGKAVLETYGEVATGPYMGTDLGRSAMLPSEKLAEAVKDLLRESNTTTTNAGISIGIGASFIVFMHIPTTDERKFAEMIPLEARKYIPVPISEVTLDWWAIPKDESTVSQFQNGQAVAQASGTEILLVVIHNDILTKNKEVQRAAGIGAAFSEVEIFSSVRASLEASIAPQMIIDFGAGSTKLFVVERGVLKASHVVNRGSQDITLALSKSLGVSFEEAEKMKRRDGIISNPNDTKIAEISSVTIDYILAESGRFVLGYYRKSGKKISKITLSGGGALLKGLRERAQNAFETPVVIADPFSKVAYPAFLEQILKQAGPEFAVALGLAIRKLQE